MDFSIQNKPFHTQAIQPTVGGKAGSNIVDLDPTSIVEQFAKMLVAQISNQDPDNAMDPTQIISQYAQMTSSLGLAKLTNQQGFFEMVQTATAVVGKTVSYLDPSDPAGGNVLTGTVTQADFTDAQPHLMIDGTSLVLASSLIKIYQ